jgi:glycerol-3-phosphate acyltransferase PlsY
MIQVSVVLIIIAYLVGSISFSHVITRWRTGQVLYDVGEGNVGARNVWYVVGRGWGLLAGTLDMIKGLVMIILASLVHLPPVAMILAGVAVMIGHQFPLFLHGHGGKGLATGGGVMLGLSPISTITGGGVMLAALAITRDFNISLIPTVISVIILPVVFGRPLWVAVCALVLAVLCGLKKLHDRDHEAQVWATHPWQGEAAPGFHPKEPSA